MYIKRKITALFLCLCLASSAGAVTAQADEKEDEIVLVSAEDFIAYDRSSDSIGEIVEDLYPAKEKVKSGLESLQRKIDVTGLGLTTDNVEDFYYSLVKENPQLFYIYTGFKYGINPYDNSVVYIMPKYITSTKDPGTDTQEEIAQQNIEIRQMKEIFDQNTQVLMSCIDQSMTDTEKLLALHDALVCHVSYTNQSIGKYPESVYTAYGAIAEGGGVCQSYTLAYEYLVKLAGIEDIVMVSGNNHTWNMVMLEGEWYHIDVTFDDPVKDLPGRVSHSYFLISDEKLLAADSSDSHETWTPEYKASSTKYDGGDNLWNFTGSQIIFDSGSIYYVDMSSSPEQKYPTGIITEINSDGSKRQLARVDEYWKAQTGFYTENYTRLFKSGGYLYFNTPTSVKRVNISDGTIENIYTLAENSSNSNYIFGLKKGDGSIIIACSENPNSEMKLISFDYDFGEGTAPEQPVYEKGDVDMNGVVDISDVTLIQKYIASLVTLDDISLADINSDGEISIDDCTMIQKIIAGLI